MARDDGGPCGGVPVGGVMVGSLFCRRRDRPDPPRGRGVPRARPFPPPAARARPGRAAGGWSRTSSVASVAVRRAAAAWWSRPRAACQAAISATSAASATANATPPTAPRPARPRAVSRLRASTRSSPATGPGSGGCPPGARAARSNRSAAVPHRSPHPCDIAIGGQGGEQVGGGRTDPVAVLTAGAQRGPRRGHRLEHLRRLRSPAGAAGCLPVDGVLAQRCCSRGRDRSGASLLPL